MMTVVVIFVISRMSLELQLLLCLKYFLICFSILLRHMPLLPMEVLSNGENNIYDNNH